MKLIQLLNLVMALCVITLFSCEKEGVSPIEKKALSQIESNTYKNCDGEVSGEHEVLPNTSEVYLFQTDFTPDLVNWTINYGDMYIQSGQGSDCITMQFGPNFNGGSIDVYGSSELFGESCSHFTIFKDCYPANSVSVAQVKEYCPNDGNHVNFRATTDNGSNDGTYYWTVGSGATIAHGQHTNYIGVVPPSYGGFSVSVKYVCNGSEVSDNTYAQPGDCLPEI